MTEFLSYTITGLSLGGHPRGRGQRTRAHVHDDGRLQLRARRDRHARRVRVLAAALRLGLADADRDRGRAPRARSAVRRVPRGRHLPRPATDDRDDQARRHRLVAVLDHRHRELDLGTEPCVQRDEVRRPEPDDRRRADHASRADHDHRRDPRRDRVCATCLFHTRSGIAMRAAVDDRPLAALHGARPDRSSMLAWAIGCSLAATSGILFVGTIELAAVPMSLLIVNAYAAAMIGRLRSLPLTFLGALILGLLTGYSAGLPRREEQPVLRLDVRRRASRSSCCSSSCSCSRARGCARRASPARAS